MRRAVLFALAVRALCLVFAANAATSPVAAPMADQARMLLDYQAFMRGDRDGGVRFCLTAARDFQGTPLADLAVRVALSYDPAWLGSIAVGENEARRLLSQEGELGPELRDILRRFVARYHAAAGRRDDAMAVHRQRGLVMSWLVAGPFRDRPTRMGMPSAGPAIAGDIVAEPPDEARFREWRKAPPRRPIPENRAFPFVRPWRWSGGDADGSMLLSTAVEMATGDNKAVFHIFSEASWRLFVDGALTAEVDRDNAEAPVEHLVSYPLTAGAHSVALQVFPPGTEVDAGEVRVALRLESEAVFAWNRDAAPEPAPRPANARRDARRLRHLTELQERAGEHPALMAAYALACAEQNMPDEAAWWAESAARTASSDVNLQHLAGFLTARNPLLPEERRRDIAAAWHQAALDLRPDLVPSLLHFAAVASEAGQSRKAAEYLDRAYAVNAGSIDVLLARAEWASRFASGATARAAWDEAGKAFPDSAGMQLAVASMPEDGFLDMDMRLAACRAAVAAGPYNPEAGLKLAEILAGTGNNQEAEYALRDARELFDGEIGVLERISGVYERLSLYEEATRALSKAVRLAPDNPALWRRLGDLRMASDDPDGAEAYWRVSLAANPGQFALGDMLANLAGESGRIYSEGGYDAIALTASANPAEYRGDVIRLLDRAVVMFAGDGSHRRLTHEVDMAKNRRGGESLVDIDSRGELLAARIVFPNGNTLEPEPFPGRGGLRLPVTMPGAARELRVLESVAAGRGAPSAIAPWFFQDPAGKMPLLLSEYVVRAPRGFPLVYAVHNLGSDVEFESTREGDEDVYRWTARLSLPSREPDAVHISERVPSVEIGVKTTWEDVTRQELRRLDGLLAPSMRMRSLLTSLYRIQPGERPDPLEAAKAIYRYVCDNIDSTPSGRLAAHVHADRMGDRGLLLLALLRASGLDADPAAARPSARFMHPPTWELPNRDAFPVPMVRLVIPGGDTYWLDVRFDSLPFGKIADDLSEATVISFLPDGPLFETLPSLPAEDSIVLNERRIALPAPGGLLEVSGRGLRRGVAGLRRGQEMAEADADARRRMLLASLHPVFPDAVLKRFDVLPPDGEDASYQVRYDVTAKVAVEERPDGAAAVGLCLVPPRIVARETRNLSPRRTVCHIKSVHIAEDRNVFLLPPGASFGRLPAPVHIPSRFGMYQLRIAPHGESGLEVVRNYHIPAQRIQPWDWAEFLDFLNKVELAEKQWIEYAVG